MLNKVSMSCSFYTRIPFHHILILLNVYSFTASGPDIKMGRSQGHLSCGYGTTTVSGYAQLVNIN